MRTYLEAFFDLTILGWVTVSDLDIFLRICVSLVGIGLTAITSIKIYKQIQRASIENEIQAERLKREQEETRRYFEIKTAIK